MAANVEIRALSNAVRCRLQNVILQNCCMHTFKARWNSGSLKFICCGPAAGTDSSCSAAGTVRLSPHKMCAPPLDAAPASAACNSSTLILRLHVSAEQYICKRGSCAQSSH